MSDFFKNLSAAVLGAKDIMLEKNKKSALINRLRTVVKCEEQSCDRAYMALGRYYYHNLRNQGDPIAEPHCAEIDSAQKRLEAALNHLEKLYSEEAKDIPDDFQEDIKETVYQYATEEVVDEVEDGFVDVAAAINVELNDTDSEFAQDGENDDLNFD